MTTSSDTELIRRLEHALTLLECATSGGPPDLIPRPSTLLTEARARLARSEPEGVTDEEIAECLVAAGVDAMEGESDGTNRMYWEGWNEQILSGIRAVIAADRARWGRPAIKPVPVAERPWEREGWCDGEGMCWRFDPCDRGWWSYGPILPSDGDPAPFTYLLPHHSLPVPTTH
jgi:hypothetical protein